MEVGDSFLIAAEDLKAGISSAAFNWGKVNNRKMATRVQPDGSMRIWRIA